MTINYTDCCFCTVSDPVHAGNNVEATFDFVEATFDIVERIVQLVALNVAWTLLLVWTGLNKRPHFLRQRFVGCISINEACTRFKNRDIQW